MWKFEFQELASRLPDVVDKKAVIIRHFTQHAVSRLRTVSLYQSTYHRQVSARADTSFATEATHFHAGYDPAEQKSQFRAQIQAITKVTVQVNGVRTSAMTELAGWAHSFARSTLPINTHNFPKTIKLIFLNGRQMSPYGNEWGGGDGRKIQHSHRYVGPNFHILQLTHFTITFT